MRRALLAGLVLLGPVLGLGACTSSSPDEREVPAGGPPGCGVAYDDVVGPEPGEPHGSLRDFRAADAVCEAWWLDLPADFVPQGLELDGATAYVVGHRAGEVGSKPCQVAAVALPSGRTEAFAARLDPPGRPGGGGWCRHGGGAALTTAGLWVVETSRLWLLDPARLDADPVVRVWTLGAGVRGSTVAATGGRLVVAGYRPRGPGRARWYDESAVLRSGATTLVEEDRASGAGEVAMVRSTRVRPACRAWRSPAPACRGTSRPRIACGVVRPGGPPARLRARRGGPGGRGAASIWTVSEASAPPYRDPGGALVPRLLRLDRAAVEDSGPATCEL